MTTTEKKILAVEKLVGDYPVEFLPVIADSNYLLKFSCKCDGKEASHVFFTRHVDLVSALQSLVRCFHHETTMKGHIYKLESGKMRAQFVTGPNEIRILEEDK